VNAKSAVFNLVLASPLPVIDIPSRKPLRTIGVLSEAVLDNSRGVLDWRLGRCAVDVESY
jgi:hypothetical protein